MKLYFCKLCSSWERVSSTRSIEGKRFQKNSEDNCQYGSYLYDMKISLAHQLLHKTAKRMKITVATKEGFGKLSFMNIASAVTAWKTE